MTIIGTCIQRSTDRTSTSWSGICSGDLPYSTQLRQRVNSMTVSVSTISSAICLVDAICNGNNWILSNSHAVVGSPIHSCLISCCWFTITVLRRYFTMAHSFCPWFLFTTAWPNVLWSVPKKDNNQCCFVKSSKTFITLFLIISYCCNVMVNNFELFRLVSANLFIRLLFIQFDAKPITDWPTCKIFPNCHKPILFLSQ